MRVRVTAKPPYGYTGVQLRTGDIVTNESPIELDVESLSDIIEPLLSSLVTIETIDAPGAATATTGTSAPPGGVAADASSGQDGDGEAGRRRRNRSAEDAAGEATAGE